MTAKTIFWSWQSDLDGRVTRDLVRHALETAVIRIAAGLEEADRPSLTSDTQGVAGTPDIVATILRKIDEAAVFVGDVTPIALSDQGKACANPNVLLELGYANRAVSDRRVIQVWNTAFAGASLEKLPFDMRGRRGPLSFHLKPGADTATLRRVRDKLANELAEALELALGSLPAPPLDAVQWQPHHPGEADVWFDPDQPQVVTSRRHGSTRVRWLPQLPGFARLIPSGWTAQAGAREALADLTSHAAVLARSGGRSAGISRGGAMVYWPGTPTEGVVPTVALTQWFEASGEFWGIGGAFLFDRKDDRRTLATGYFYELWCDFLERNGQLALDHGGSLPLHVRLGIPDLRGSWWPRGRFDFDDDEGFAAVEDSYLFEGTLTGIGRGDVEEMVTAAFNGLATIYGVGPFSHAQIVEFSR